MLKTELKVYPEPHETLRSMSVFRLAIPTFFPVFACIGDLLIKVACSLILCLNYQTKTHYVENPVGFHMHINSLKLCFFILPFVVQPGLSLGLLIIRCVDSEMQLSHAGAK